MRELQKTEYHKIGRLAQGGHYQLSVASVIAGATPGEVYADCDESPESVLIKTPECVVVAGNAMNSEFNCAIRDVIDFFEPIICDSHEWEKHLREFHSNAFLRKYSRTYYQFHNLRYDDCGSDLDPENSLTRIDHRLLEREDMGNVRDVRDWVTEGWGSIEHFEQHGLGMCIHNQVDIMSWCLLDCRLDQKVEMGVHTAPSFRRRGYGAICVAAAVEACLEREIRDIGWHCVAANIGSRKVAEKVGFRRSADYAAHTPYPPIENETDLDPTKWAEWASYYEDASRVEPRLSCIAAECWARAGDVERTIFHLEQDVESGWRPTRQELSQNGTFLRFHDTAAWTDFVGSLQ